jgi:hypothetical protein
MRATGHIVQYSPEDKRGMIHLGGKGDTALLSFVLEDCDKAVCDKLLNTAIPEGHPLSVAFDITLKNRGLWATGICFSATEKGGRKTAGEKVIKKAAARKPRR